MKRTLLTLMLMAGPLLTAGCAPLIIGGALVAADEVVEQDKGGDGLF